MEYLVSIKEFVKKRIEWDFLNDESGAIVTHSSEVCHQDSRLLENVVEDVIIPPLTEVVNCCFRDRHFPEDLKLNTSSTFANFSKSFENLIAKDERICLLNIIHFQAVDIVQNLIMCQFERNWIFISSKAICKIVDIVIFKVLL